MEQAQQNLKKLSAKNSKAAGEKIAKETLKNLKQVKKRIEELSSKKKFNKNSFAKELLNDFKKIQQRQNKIFKNTKKISFQNRKQLEKQQLQNNHSFFEWSDNLSKAILSLNDKNYKAILSDLKKIKREVGSFAISSKMEKNRKYLQFNRKKQSLKQQEKILEKLGLLQQRIEMMSQKRPKMDMQQLLKIKKKYKKLFKKIK